MPFAALGFPFDVEAADPRLQAHCHRLFRHLRTDDPPAGTYRFTAGAGGLDLAFADTELIAGATPAEAIDMLVSHINMQAVVATTYGLLVHAAALADARGTGLALIGGSGSGKSTLGAMLVRDGLHYLSDETAVVNEHTHVLTPFPKPFSIKRGSHGILADLAPREDYPGGNWYLDPLDLNPRALDAPAATLRHVVHVTYRPGAATSLEPMGVVDTMLAMGENSSRIATNLGERVLVRLEEVARAVTRHRLTVGDDGAAAEVVRREVLGS